MMSHITSDTESTINRATAEINVSQTVQLRSVSATPSPTYSFTSQKPPSLTWLNGGNEFHRLPFCKSLGSGATFDAAPRRRPVAGTRSHAAIMMCGR
ncbi:hypothetical protein SPHINGO8AM_70131 [Sphingomonas sp. 8AM]|nr:hypothetical protein SPHINGO8AM_70131 [Sphingomonas sp. 8AM]